MLFRSKTVLIPKENEKDLKEIPALITRGLQLIPVEHMDEVLMAALAHADVRGFLRVGEHVVAAIFAGADGETAASTEATRIN